MNEAFPKPTCKKCGVRDYERARRDAGGEWRYYCVHCEYGKPGEPYQPRWPTIKTYNDGTKRSPLRP